MFARIVTTLALAALLPACGGAPLAAEAARQGPVAARALRDPGDLLAATFKDGGYLAPLAALRAEAPRYRGTAMEREFQEAYGTWLSYVGDHRGALAAFGFQDDSQDRTLEPHDLARVEGAPAVAAIAAAARAHRAVFVNEAHHVPKHRALTWRLLHALRAEGYRYFAAETLYQDAALARRGYPQIDLTGYYTREPLYADLVRTALALGYEVVAYEHEGGYTGDPATWGNQRETGQARNLTERIFRKDPTAKALVHVGYGHHAEGRGESWTPMGHEFKRLSGLDPLTVEQEVLDERHRPAHEHPAYQPLLDRLRPTEPLALRFRDEPARGDLGLLAGMRDMVVLHPRTRDVDGRPDWLALGGARSAWHAPAAWRSPAGGEPVLLAAYVAGEQGLAVPIDQVMPGAGRWPPLMLPAGRFQVRLLDVRGGRLAEQAVTIPGRPGAR